MPSGCVIVYCPECGDAGLGRFKMSVTADRDDDLVYTERISSAGTEALFLALTALFAWLSVRRVKAKRRDFLATVFGCFFAVFLFYSVNYRALIIRLTPEALKLKVEFPGASQDRDCAEEASRACARHLLFDAPAG